MLITLHYNYPSSDKQNMSSLCTLNPKMDPVHKMQGKIIYKENNNQMAMSIILNMFNTGCAACIHL